jgi:hypothetical protein
LAAYLFLANNPFKHDKEMMPYSLAEELENEYILLMKQFNTVEELYYRIALR